MSTLTNAIRYSQNSALASPSVGDLYLPVYGGQVLTRFAEYLGIANMVRRQTIMSGNTARFPRLGGIGAERHAANTQLLGLDGESTEIEITLDSRPLVSHSVLDDIDVMLTHFESRSVWANEQGQALAEAKDQLALRLLINASRETPTTMYGGANSSFPGGSIAGDGVALDSSSIWATASARPTDDQIGAFLDLLDQIVERWDAVRVPFNDRNVMLPVQPWHGIRNFGSPRSASDLANIHGPLFMDTTGTYGAQVNMGQFLSQSPDFQQSLVFNGMQLWRSNIANLVMGSDLSSDDEAKYQGDFTLTRAIAWQADAVALVDKMALITETDRQVAYQNDLLVSKIFGGGGTLRPECAIEIAYDNS